jgi:type-F conjugative transfer system pilin assembly protein TrbC
MRYLVFALLAIPLFSDEEPLFIRQSGFSEEFYVLMSFSVPDEIWIALSDSVCRSGGKFVVRGFPNNSLKSFVDRIQVLSDKGLKAEIEVNPDLFGDVRAVPCFVIGNCDEDRVTGAVTVDFALQKFQELGNYSEAAKHRRANLRA